MMLKWQVVVVCNYYSTEGYVAPGHSTNGPRALHFVTAAVATSVSIQSNGRINTIAHNGDKS
jgi:hypothetical protein